MTPPYIALVLKILAVVLFLTAALGVPLAANAIAFGLACWAASTI